MTDGPGWVLAGCLPGAVVCCTVVVVPLFCGFWDPSVGRAGLGMPSESSSGNNSYDSVLSELSSSSSPQWRWTTAGMVPLGRWSVGRLNQNSHISWDSVPWVVAFMLKVLGAMYMGLPPPIPAILAV